MKNFTSSKSNLTKRTPMRISRFGKRFLRFGLFAILATAGLWLHSAPAETAQKIITPAERPPMFVLQVGIGKYLGRGSIDPINVSACIDQHTISAPPIEQIPVTLLPISMCAINANTYFGAVSGDDGSAVALAVGIIYPVALVANANAAGLKGGGVWLQQYRSVNEAIVARLAPKCRPHSAGTEQVRYDCAAYEVAMSVRPKLEALADQVPTSP